MRRLMLCISPSENQHGNVVSKDQGQPLRSMGGGDPGRGSIPQKCVIYLPAAYMCERLKRKRSYDHIF